MKLKINKVATIDCSDFDDLVMETYGRLYCLQQQDGCMDRQNIRITVPVDDPGDYNRDSIPEKVNHEITGVSFEAWLSRDPKQKLSGQQFDFDLGFWWDRNFYPHLDMVLNDLHKKGLIDAGEYIIIIDW